MAFYVGMPPLGGAVTTRGGLTFYSATQDYCLRAFNTETGEEVWKGRLPSGSQATPMTYIDKASGRQFVVATAGGALQAQGPGRLDHRLRAARGQALNSWVGQRRWALLPSARLG